ncbi:MAG: methylcrotonoyl-CoA carboxylase, partial [Phototrophicales bacterium]
SSGVADHFAENDEHAIEIARSIFRSMKNEASPSDHCQTYDEPLYSPDELTGIVPVDLRKPYDCREVIARLVDGSRFHEFKADYGNTLVTAFAEIHGHPIG